MRLTRHHLLISLGFVLHMYNNTAYRFLDSFLPSYSTEQQKTSDFEVGIMFSSFCLVIFILSPIFGSICQRRGYRTLIIAGLVAEGCILCFLSLSSRLDGPSFIAYLTLLRALEGAGSAATQTGCYALLAAESGDEGEGAGTGMGGMEMFGGLGNMAGPIIGAWLSATYGYQTPFIAVGMLGLLAAVGTAFALPTKQRLIDEVDLDFIQQNTLPVKAPASVAPTPLTLSPSSSAYSYTVPSAPSQPTASSRAEISTSVRAYVGEDVQAVVASAPPQVSIVRVLQVPSVMYTCVVAATGLGCMSFLSATLELAFRQQHQLDDVEVGMAFAMMSFVQLLFCPIAGWVADTYATKLPMVLGLSLLSGSLLMLGPSPLFGIAPSLPLQLVALCLLGSGVSLSVIPTFVDQIKSTAHLGVSSQPVIAGLSASSFSLGEVLGPFLGASLVSLTSFETASTVLAGVCAAVLAAGVALMWLGIVSWDAGKARETARAGAEEEMEMVEGKRPAPTTPLHKPKVKGIVKRLREQVDQRQWRRKGYEKAESHVPSPENSPVRRKGPHYSPSDSFILPEGEPPSPRPLPPTRGEKAEEEKEGGDEGEEEEGLQEVQLGLDDDLEDIDVVGEAGGVDYDLEGDEEKEEDSDAPLTVQVNIRPRDEADDGGHQRSEANLP